MDTQNEAKNHDEQNTAKDIPLKIISIPDKEWKEYRNQASQDELLVLGLGMKLWLAKTRKSTLFFTLALLVSVAVGIIITILTQGYVGVIILALGYLIFCTLCVRRHDIQDSLDKTKRKLTAENKKALDAELKSSGGAKFADVFMSIILITVCEPYFLVLGVLSAIIPSLLNTKLVIPEGYGFEQLEEVKSYYAEKSFLSDVVDMCVDYDKTPEQSTAPESSPTDEYYRQDEHTYTDEHGYTQTVYTDHGSKEARDVGGHYVGEVSDEAGEKKFTPAGQSPKADDDD